MWNSIVRLVQMMLSFIMPGIWTNLPPSENQHVEIGSIQEGNTSSQRVDPNISTSGLEQTVIDMDELVLRAHVSSPTPAITVERIPPSPHGYNTLEEGPRRDSWMISHQQPDTTAANTVEVSTQTAQTRETAGTQATETTSSQATNINGGLRVAKWVTTISSTGMITVMAGFLGNQTSKPTRHFLFKGSMCSMLASFFLGISIFTFSIICSQSSILGVVTKILVVATVASIAMFVGFGAAFYFENA